MGMLFVVVLVLFSGMTCFAGEYLAKWTDWAKMDQYNVQYRIRCHKQDTVRDTYLWDIEVENNMLTASKIAVALTRTNGDVLPDKDWLTWPIFVGSRHKFTDYRCKAGPGEKVRVLLRNLSAEKTASQKSWKRYGQTKSNNAKEEKTFLGCGKEWLVGPTDLDWNQAQAWITKLGKGWRAPTKAELVELFDELGQNSPIGQDYVWAEAKDEHSAWHYSFYYREVRWGYFDDHSAYGRSVAVR